MSKKLRGIKRINKIINKFLEPFEAECELGDEFAYLPRYSKIKYTLCVSDMQDKAFLAFAEHLAPDIKCDIFLLSLLHELGHHETGDEYDITQQLGEYDRLNATMMLIRELDANNVKAMAKIALEYFQLPWEQAATEWALDYMRNNKAEIAAFWNKLSKAIQRVYRLNHIS